mmetsp:Transcript_40155/g.93299  ORF Transcript_40155/g.93299 Transcript_40155/m.93299 type:complete len:370 (-) Transcript_40155:156-1265(-)
MLGFWFVLGLFGITRDMFHPENVVQVVGGLAGFLSLLGSSVHIIRHLMLNHTVLRSCTVRILFVVPIFSLDCFASLLVEGSHMVELLSCFREVYEAFVLASFMQLVLTLLGGPRALRSRLQEEGPCVVHQLRPLRHLPGLRQPYENASDFVASMLRGILQYVAVMILVFLVKLFILVLDGPRSPTLILPDIVKSMSCGWALNCIVLFSHEVYNLLPNLRLFLKFLSIKGIVFFTFWQAITINVLQQTGRLSSLEDYVKNKAQESDLRELWWNEFELKSGINDLLLCFEMLFFCGLHWWAYPARELQNHELFLRLEDRGHRSFVGRILDTLQLKGMADLYNELTALQGEVTERRRAHCSPILAEKLTKPR